MRQKRLRNRPPPSGTDVHVLVQIEPLDPKYSPFDELCRLLSRRLAGFQKPPRFWIAKCPSGFSNVHFMSQIIENPTPHVSGKCPSGFSPEASGSEISTL